MALVEGAGEARSSTFTNAKKTLRVSPADPIKTT